MARTAAMQFTFLTPLEARLYLARCEQKNTRTAENHGDRIMAQRRVALPPAPMPLAEFFEKYPPGRQYPNPFKHRG